jgi:hypothetical protein
MALAIKPRHRRNNKLAVGKVAVGTATHGHTAPTHILPGRRSGYKARRYRYLRHRDLMVECGTPWVSAPMAA